MEAGQWPLPLFHIMAFGMHREHKGESKVWRGVGGSLRVPQAWDFRDKSCKNKHVGHAHDMPRHERAAGVLLAACWSVKQGQMERETSEIHADDHSHSLHCNVRVRTETKASSPRMYTGS